MLCLLLIGFNNVQGKQVMELKALQVGDRIPDLPMAKVLINGRIISLNSKDYKDKLLVLDFWDTFCGSCIEAFPRLDDLQKTFGDKMQIITVTYQKEDLIRKFKDTNKMAKQFSLPIMVEDDVLKSYFPYRFVSHTVWINKGVVIAISSPEYLVKPMITKVLNGEKINLPIKDDFISYDFKNNSLLGNERVIGKNIYSVITGYRDKATANGPQKSTLIDSVNGTVKDTYLNMEISRLYLSLLMVNTEPILYRLKPDMIIIESKKPVLYDMNYNKEGDFATDWVRKYSICYESVLPVKINEKERAKLMIADLDNKLGLHGRLELRPHKVYVIKSFAGPKPTLDLTKNGENKSVQNYDNFKNMLLFSTLTVPQFEDFLPIVDESNTKPDKQIEMYSYTDFPSLKRAMNMNGLDITEELRPIRVFVLSETRNN